MVTRRPIRGCGCDATDATERAPCEQMRAVPRAGTPWHGADMRLRATAAVRTRRVLLRRRAPKWIRHARAPAVKAPQEQRIVHSCPRAPDLGEHAAEADGLHGAVALQHHRRQLVELGQRPQQGGPLQGDGGTLRDMMLGGRGPAGTTRKRGGSYGINNSCSISCTGSVMARVQRPTHGQMQRMRPGIESETYSRWLEGVLRLPLRCYQQIKQVDAFATIVADHAFQMLPRCGCCLDIRSLRIGIGATCV